MKKLFLLLMIVMMASCATNQTTAPKEDPYANLTLEKVSKYCQPTNLWNVGVLGNPAMIVTFEDCLEVEELMVVIAPVMENSEELGITIVKVVQLSYVQYLSESNADKTYTVKVLKSMLRPHPEEEAKSHVYFYSLESTKKSN